MERYDIAIIGTGPAGLSAALTAKARNKSIILFGSKSGSEKVIKAHQVKNYLGLPDVTGSEMQRVFIKQITDAGIEITDEKVILIYPAGSYFSIQTSSGIREASSVIIACGMVTANEYPGEKEFLGRGVSYCATCDGAFYKGKTVAVIGGDPGQDEEADFLTEYAEKVIYFPLYKEECHVNEKVDVIREKPVSVNGTLKVNKLVTDHNEYDVDGVFVLRSSIAPAQLLPGLDMDQNHIMVKRDMSTNVPGCFAAGDITGTPYQYIKSAGEGNVAVLSAVSYLNTQKEH